MLTLILCCGLLPAALTAATDADYQVDVPGNLYYVSPAGDDANPGTRTAPLRTISRGAALAQPGDAVLVDEGVYRERVSPPRGGAPGMPIVYKARPDRNVVIKGSVVWQPAWTASGTGGDIVYAVPDPALFTDDAYWDDADPLKVGVSSTPWSRDGKPENAVDPTVGDPNLVYTLGQVFIDSKMAKQVPFVTEMQQQPGTWCYEASSQRLWLHQPSPGAPDRFLIELTVRRRIFAPHLRGLGYIDVIGFVMEHCGNQFPRDFWAVRENAQAGALGTRSGHHWLIQGNVVRYANAIGMDIGGESNLDSERTDQPRPYQVDLGYHVVEANRVIDNGACGIAGSISTALVIRGNVVERNNNLFFDGYKRFEQAGIKLHDAKGALVKGNLVRGNHTFGIWHDDGHYDGMRVTGNLIANNEDAGIQVEQGAFTSEQMVIDDNLFIANRGCGVYARGSSGLTLIHNLFANSTPSSCIRGCALYVHLGSVAGSDDTTNHIAFYNNLVLGNTVEMDVNYPKDLAVGRDFERNVYQAASRDRTFYLNPYCSDPAITLDSLYALVNADLGGRSPGIAVFGQQYRAMLTFNEWKILWGKHTGNHDQHSVLSDGSVALDPVTLALNLTLAIDPTKVGAVKHPLMDVDYAGLPIPQDGSARPGPLQAVRRGPNQFAVWNGVRPLAEGEMPYLTAYARPAPAENGGSMLASLCLHR